MPSVQLQELKWLGFLSLLLEELLNVKDLLVLANELMSVTLEYISLLLHSIMHLLEDVF